MNLFFKHYDTFYNMVLSTTIMSNAICPAYLEDSKRIIDFIGKAYRLDDKFIKSASDFILGDLTSLGLTTDQLAVYGDRQYGDEYSDLDVLFDIKGDVLNKLQYMASTAEGAVNSGWFDFSHYKTYQADVRFAKINTAGASGDVICTRQIGILRILGIGCPVNIHEGIVRLYQCVCWGDIPATYYLAYAYSLLGDEKNSKLFYEIAELFDTYLKAGYTVLPAEANARYSERARLNYVYISSIKQDVVFAYKRYKIDFSFVEAITSPGLEYSEIMYHINNYGQYGWKEITNSSAKPVAQVGF